MTRPAPRTDAQWAREVERRLRALDQKSAVQVGPWSILNDEDGELVAAKPGQVINLDPNKVAVDAEAITRGMVTTAELVPVADAADAAQTAADNALASAGDALGSAAAAAAAAAAAGTAAGQAQTTADSKLGPDDSLNAGNLTGTAPPGTVALIGAGSVSSQRQNLIASQRFLTSTSLGAAEIWSWDPTGDATPGSAKASPAGYESVLVSSEVTVTEGETISLQIRMKWSALTYSGTSPVTFGVQMYRKTVLDDAVQYVDVGGVDLVALTSPAVSSGGRYVTMSTPDDFTVPERVDQLRFRLRVAKEATGGVINFDEAEMYKTSLIGDSSVPGVGLTIDAIVQALFGWTGIDFGRDQAYNALNANANALLSVTAKVAQLEAQGHTGAIAGDDFTWSGPIVDHVNWSGFYTAVPSGYYTGNGHAAQYVPIWPTLAFSNTMGFRWEGPDNQSQTDYQLGQLVLASAPVNLLIAASQIHILGRISADWQSYIRFIFTGYNTYELHNVVAGNTTVMTSGSCPQMGTGALLSVKFGDAGTGNPRHFSAAVGTEWFCEFNEVGTTSMYGPANRRWGWGGQAYWLFPTIFAVEPPQVDQWLGMDQ